MNFILSISIISTATAILLGVLFFSKGNEKLISNKFLGIFFLLLSLRLGKLLVQVYSSGIILDIYFNLMHASYMAIGPVIYLYINAYIVRAQSAKNNYFHFIPSLFFLLAAFSLRQVGGEYIWIYIYWLIQLHPLFYVIWSLKILIEKFSSNGFTINQKIWLFSLLVSVTLIAAMNILYFILFFPFYLVTSVLVLITAYLVLFLAFNNKTNILLGKSDQKYKSLNLEQEHISRLKKDINKLLVEEELFLNSKIKLADISDRLKTPTHVISMIINETSGMNFPEFVNTLRIERARKKMIEEKEKKIIAIAFESGFYSLSSFNRAFKSRTGMNPSEFRSKYSV